MFRRKWLLAFLVLLVVGIGAASTFWFRRGEVGTRVNAEALQRRDLEAIVSASGKIDPKKTVNISAQSMGRVTSLGVNEGDRVKAGQFLLQIDPVSAESLVRRDEASVAAARTGLDAARIQVKSAQANLDLARLNLKRQEELWAGGLTTRETLEKTQSEVEVREMDLRARESEIQTREEQLRQQQAGLTSTQHNLRQSRFESPFDGIVTVIETFGGTVSDAEYAALLAAPPRWVYLASGGRALLTPPVTLLVAIALWGLVRLEGAPVTLAQGLSVAVHANVVLLVGQLAATPIHYVRESLTSPLNFAAILPLMEEGTLPTRFFGSMDLFAAWWVLVLAIGLGVLTRKPASRYAMSFAAVYAAFAAVVAALIAVMGGS